MVFGLFEGNTLNIILDKPSYTMGEPVTGKVVLELKKPKKAKGVRVSIYLEYETERIVNHDFHSNAGGVRHNREIEHYTHRMCEKSIQLDSEKEYVPGVAEYRFSIPTVKTSIMPVGYAKINGWFIDASLDIPMSSDVSKKLQLNLI